MKHTNTSSTAKRICIVTSDFAGITHNGGIGTACANLTYALAAEGHNVTIAYTFGNIGDGNVGAWQSKLADIGINLELIEVSAPTVYGTASFHQYMSLNAYLWLREQDDFDFIHFPDWRGTGYYTTLAKKYGLAFHNSEIIIQLHSPTLWHRVHNKENMASIDLLDTHFLEKNTIAMADRIISPSHYLVKWCRSKKWEFPEHTDVIQNLLSPNFALSQDQSKLEADDIKEIVFFGRLEIRKGALLFCKALAKLKPDLLKGKQITFLGKESLIHKRPSLEILHKELDKLSIKWQAHTDMNSDEAIAYLQGKGRLVVIASLVENSPYVVLESLGFGFPFIATDSGGTAELIHKHDRKHVLFLPTVTSLKQKLHHALAKGMIRARMSVSQQNTRTQWLQTHTESTTHLPPLYSSDNYLYTHIDKRIGVCIFFHESIEHLRNAIISFQQDPHSSAIDIMVVPVQEVSEETLLKLEKLCANLDVDLDTTRTRIPFDVFFPDTYSHVLYMHEYCIFQPNIISYFISQTASYDCDILTSFVTQKVSHSERYDHLPFSAEKDLLSLYNSVGNHYFYVKQSIYSTIQPRSFSLPLHESYWQLLRSFASNKNCHTVVLPEAICSNDSVIPSKYSYKINKKFIKKISDKLVK